MHLSLPSTYTPITHSLKCHKQGFPQNKIKAGHLKKKGISKLVVNLFCIELFPYFNIFLSTLGPLKLVNQGLNPVSTAGYKGLGKTLTSGLQPITEL